MSDYIKIEPSNIIPDPMGAERGAEADVMEEDVKPHLTSPTSPQSERSLAPSSAAEDEIEIDSILISTPQLKKPRQNQSRLARLEYKERAAAIGVSALKSLRMHFERGKNDIPELAKWHKETAPIVDQDSQPKVSIGLYGATGVGKSSVINALIGMEVLECSPMHACTAVATEVSYNYDDDPMRAVVVEIEMESEDEVITDLEACCGDMMDASGLMDPSSGNIKELHSKSDGGVAQAKVKAICPEINLKDMSKLSANQILSQSNLQDMLGTTRTFAASNIQQLRGELSKYLASYADHNKSGKEPVYWPLVRRCRIYVKSPWLRRTGITLVDLPGVGDSNAARSRVAEAYIKDLDAVWIVCPINRAVDDQTAHELLDKSFRRQAMLDGKLTEQHVSIIMTHSDNISVEEMLRSYATNLEEDPACSPILEKVRETEELIESRKEKLRRKKDSLRKAEAARRKFQKEKIKASKRLANEISVTMEEVEESREASLAHQHQLKAGISKLKDSLEQLAVILAPNYEKLRRICIKKRNEWARDEKRRRFALELWEMQEDPSERDARNWYTQCEAIANNLPVFCVSSKAFNQLTGLIKSEGLIKGFLNCNDTEIPALLQHCLDTSIPAREKVADELIKELQLILEKFILWSQYTLSGAPISREQREMLERAFTEIYEGLKEEFSRQSTDMMKIPERCVDSDISYILHKANNVSKAEVKKVPTRWFESKDKLYFHWATMNAIIRRMGGPSQNRHGRKFNLNEMLAEPFLNTMTITWDKVVNKTIPDYVDSFINLLIELFKSFMADLPAAISQVHRDSAERLKLILSQMPYLAFCIRRDCRAALEEFLNEARVINRMPQLRVLEEMTDIYLECAQDKGMGVVKRNEERIKGHVDRIRRTMFHNLAEDMLAELRAAVNKLDDRLKNVFKLTIHKPKRDFTNTLNMAQEEMASQSTQPEKTAMQKVVIEHVNDLQRAWNDPELSGLCFNHAEDSESENDNADLGDEGDFGDEEYANEDDDDDERVEEFLRANSANRRVSKGHQNASDDAMDVDGDENNLTDDDRMDEDDEYRP